MHLILATGCDGPTATDQLVQRHELLIVSLTLATAH